MSQNPQDAKKYSQYKSLLNAVERLGRHDHLCLIYETQEEQFAAVIPFIRVGLERGEKCVYIADDNTSAQVLEAMAAGGIDTGGTISSGALSVLTKQGAYLKQGSFDPDWMIGFLKEATNAAKAEGYSALRVTGEMTWMLGGDLGSERLIEYESKLNYFFPENDALAICQYNFRRFTPEIILDVIRTHPSVIYRGQVCRNFYYTPPEEMLLPNQPYLEVGRLLYNIFEREKVEELRDEAEEELKKVNAELQDALGKVKVLHGLLPICASCKKIRDDKGYWQGLEHYISEHSGAEFTHGICPECAEEYWNELKELVKGQPDRA